MRFLINSTPITPFLAPGGLVWKRNDVDSPNAGRDLAGTMHRGRVTSKVTLDCKCRPLKAGEARIVLQAIHPETVLVSYDDPEDGYVTKSFYVSSVPATHLMTRGGIDYWEGIAFTLIEV